MAVEQRQDFQVLTLEAVRWSLDALKAARVHPFFLAYLHLRKQAAEQGTMTDITPNWEELGTYLRVRGGPPNKPYYRPLWNGRETDPGRYWLNPNLAGSYAPSSLRNVPLRVVAIAGGRFSLRSDHAQLAREYLLYDQPISAIAMAAFLYRDFGFASEISLNPRDLEDELRADFHYSLHDEEFDLLFSDVVPIPIDRWFEPFTEEWERA